MAVSAAGRTLESIALDVANIASRLRALAAGDDSWTGAAAVAAHVRTASLPPTSTKQTCHTQQRVARSVRTRARSPTRRTSRLPRSLRLVARAPTSRQQSPRTLRPRARDVDGCRRSHAQQDCRRHPRLRRGTRRRSMRRTSQLRRAVASNDDAHEQQRQAARTAAAALQQASHAGIHNQSWFHHVTHSVGHWASTHWTATLREVSKIGTIVSALAGAAALILAVAGVAFPPLEAAAAAAGNGVARQRSRGRNGRHSARRNRQGFLDGGRRRRPVVCARRPRQARHKSSTLIREGRASQTDGSGPRERRRCHEAAEPDAPSDTAPERCRRVASHQLHTPL